MAHPGGHLPGPHPYSIPSLGPLQAERQGVLMHNRGAPPAGTRYNIPQVDGASAMPEDDFAEVLAGHGGAARRRMLERYPWMREAKFGGAAAYAQREMQIPQVDGPSGGGGSSIPPLSLNLSDIPALNLPNTNGTKKEEATEIPPLSTTLKMADIPPLQMPAHPSLKSPPPPPSAPLSRSSTVASTSTIKTEEGKSKPTPIANFARNPNLPAQANEDINSDLDDSDEEETEDPNGLPTDPDANVTYCTYDKVRNSLRLHSNEIFMLVPFADLGDASEDQMEGGLPRWDGSCERQGLFVRTVYRVRPPFHTSLVASLLTRRNGSEFDW
jgi:hypothetical protein